MTDQLDLPLPKLGGRPSTLDEETRIKVAREFLAGRRVIHLARAYKISKVSIYKILNDLLEKRYVWKNKHYED